MNRKIIDSFVDEGLGFPIILYHAPMVELAGEWCLDVNLAELHRIVLDILVRKKAALTGREVRFIRKYFEMTKSAFAELAGVSHVAVVKWEAQGEACAKMNVTNERWVRLFVVEKLHADSEEFLSAFRTLTRWGVEKSPIQPIVVDLAEELQRAS